MFGVDFSELMVILVIALIVIGPERLPKVARTLGHLWSRAQRYVNSVKSDIARDLSIEEFRQLQQSVQQEAAKVEQSLKQVSQNVEQQVQEINKAAMTEIPGNNPPKAAPLPPPDQKQLPAD